MPFYAPNLLNTFLLAIVLVMLLQRAARSIGLVDVPGGRKMHKGRIPVIGGLAMFAALMVAMPFLDKPLRAPWEFVFGLSILVLLGVLDDRFNLNARVKLAIQSIAALILIVPNGHMIAGFLGHGAWELRALAVPFTVIFVVGLINAFNMLDGIDGLAGGTAASAFFWLAAVAAGARLPYQAVLFMLLFATLGFLVFNMRHPWCRRATVFMGDAGSMMLGAAVAFFIVVLAGGSAPPAPFPALLWICAIPAIETLSLMVRRLRAGNDPLVGDRRHLHHLLLDAGVTPRGATGLMVASAFALGGVGVSGAYLGVSNAVMMLGLLLLFTVHTALVVWLGRVANEGRGAVAATAQPAPGSTLRSALGILPNPALDRR